MNRIYNICLIEDSETQTLMLQSVFDSDIIKQKHRINNYFTLADGLQAIRENNFDLLILDLNLPDSEGFDTLKKVTQYSSSIPIVILTGEYNKEELDNAFSQDNVAACFVKGSFNNEALLGFILLAIEKDKRIKAEKTLIEISEKYKKLELMIIELKNELRSTL